MSKASRLFEKLADGKLMEVDASTRGSRRISRVSMELDVLWSLEEEAARDAEELAFSERKLAEAREAAIPLTPQQKLAAAGLSVEELKALLAE